MATGLNNYSGLSELGLFFEISYFDTLMVEQKSVLKTDLFSLLYTTNYRKNVKILLSFAQKWLEVLRP